jgi:xanthine dehydrogenase large subunit
MSVHQALPHESAALQVSGAAIYVDDIPEVAGTCHLALGLSPHACAAILSCDFSAVLAAPGVLAVFTGADFPGLNDCGPVIADEPILAVGEVRYVGQPIFAVVARSHHLARQAARLAKINYDIKPAVLTIEAAHAAQSYVVPPMGMQRGDAAHALAESPHTLTGRFGVGGQEQFYLEGQVAYALPTENQGLLIHSSTQHPSEMQQVVAHCLGWAAHQVQVQCRRMGGGFGGKESQSALYCCVTALCASKLQRPVKCRLDRDDDFLITGKRHDFLFDYQIGFDEHGLITALSADFLARAGHSADLSAAVVTRALCHVDNAYFLPHVALRGYCCKTNTQSNTAFRGFGGPQGVLLIEYLIERIAEQLQLDPLTVRERNLYGKTERNTTPYGMLVHDNIAPELIAQLVASSDYHARQAAIAAFNASSPVLKKGIALSPVKFGISFNVVFLNQAGALVHIYQDGSILVNHGGTEMGQGINTKVAQVVAQVFDLPIKQVRCTATDTQKIANTSATAASTGADLNGKAAQAAALTLRSRLSAFALQQYGHNAQFEAGEVIIGNVRKAFAALVREAYLARVQLWSDGFYTTPDLSWSSSSMQGRPFYYFAYGAAVSEVMIDTLTGEAKVLRTDILHDVGKSLNPAIDRGQIEGGFVQGMGWLTTEELHWNASGKLTTHAPSTYKIPVASDVPAVLNVALWDAPNTVDSIHQSKAVGEPPLLHGISVYLAIRAAVQAARPTGSKHFVLPPPATSAAIFNALHSG